MEVKEGVETKLKFKKLKRRLRLPEWQAVGLLESIWKLCRTSAQEGDIGRYSNEDIAAAIEYEGDADEMINALVECEWIDADPEFRLVVHDWSEHVPTYIKGNFAKHNRTFADLAAKQRAKQVAKQLAISTVLPYQALPSQALPSQHTHTQDARAEGFEVEWQRWLDYRFQVDGQRLGEIQADTVLYKLVSSGPEKARRDITFSIEKGAKSILDADNDFQKQRSRNHHDKPAKVKF